MLGTKLLYRSGELLIDEVADLRAPCEALRCKLRGVRHQLGREVGERLWQDVLGPARGGPLAKRCQVIGCVCLGLGSGFPARRLATHSLASE